MANQTDDDHHPMRETNTEQEKEQEQDGNRDRLKVSIGDILLAAMGKQMNSRMPMPGEHRSENFQ